MKQITKVINNDVADLKRQLAKDKEAINYYTEKKKVYQKKKFYEFIIFLAALVLGKVYNRWSQTMLVCLAVVGALAIASFLKNLWRESKCVGNLSVCKRCYPQLERYLNLVTECKILEITYSERLDVNVTIAAEKPSGDLVQINMICARITSPSVNEVTLDVRGMAVYFPKGKIGHTEKEEE